MPIVSPVKKKIYIVSPLPNNGIIMPFVTAVPKKGSIDLTEEQIKGIFKQHDKNGDGVLSKEELKEAFRTLGALIPGWRASRGLRYADANGDGYISEGELDALVKYAASLGYTVK